MWKCPNCETVNNGDVCVICGEPKPVKAAVSAPVKSVDIKSERAGVVAYADGARTAKTFKSDKKDRRKNRFIFKAVILVLTVVMVICGLFLAEEIVHYQAKNALSEYNYEKAIKYSTLIGFRNGASDLLTEAKYKQALVYVNNNKYDDALKLLKGLDQYKDTSKLKKYISIKKLVSNKKPMEALELSKNIEDYKDVKTMADEIKQEIYEEGINLYHNKDYSESQEYLEAIEEYEYKDVEKYILLIKGHLGTLSDISKLYSIIDFEDAKEILLSDDYIIDYLMGKWTSASGDTLEFYKKYGDTSTWCTTSIPSDSGSWHISDGIHYIEYANQDVKQWSYEAVSGNDIKVYCYKNGRTYSLHRR